MDDYLTEALFGIQNDFDNISRDISYGQSRIPDMINIIGKNAFERDTETLKNASHEISNLFLAKNKQFYIQQPKNNESLSKNAYELEFPSSLEENNNINSLCENSISQDSKNIQNKRFQYDYRSVYQPNNINVPIEYEQDDFGIFIAHDYVCTFL